MLTPSLIVVDDEPDLCELIADYLARHGFHVRTASCGAALDATMCAGCHDARWTTGPAGADGPGAPARQEIAVKMVPVAKIGTDPKAAANFAGRRAYVAAGSDQAVTAAQGLQEVTDRVIERWFARNAVPEAAAEWRRLEPDRLGVELPAAGIESRVPPPGWQQHLVERRH